MVTPTEPNCPARLEKFRTALDLPAACDVEPNTPLPCIESIDRPNRCVHCSNVMRRNVQRAATHVFGGLLAPDEPPLSHGTLVELRQQATNRAPESLSTWRTIARLLDALDIANAETRDAENFILKLQGDAEQDAAHIDRLETAREERRIDAATADEHPGHAVIEQWRSDAQRGIDNPRSATYRIVTLCNALQASRRANIELGRVTLETARELEQRLELIKTELAELHAKAESIHAARVLLPLQGAGGSHATVSTRSAFGLDPAVIEPSLYAVTDAPADDAPHGPVCVSLDAGCPDCLRLQRAAARKRAH